MIELLFQKKHSKTIFNIALMIICVGIAYACTYFLGGALISYLFGGIFWITGRYFYQRIDGILKASERQNEPD